MRLSNRKPAARSLCRSRFTVGAAALLVPFASSSPSLAQEFQKLEGIVVYSANRFPTEATKVGSSVDVITRDEIEAQSRPYLRDYLEQVPGVSFNQNGPAGTTSGIFLRGAGSQYVKVLVDGIDISDPSGTQNIVQFENLLVGDVDRIEVLKGSQSTLYGADAVGGVITLATRDATVTGLSQSGAAEYGAFDTWRGAYTSAFASTNSSVAFTIQGVRSNGFSSADENDGNTEADGFDNLTLSGRGEYRVAEGVSVFFAARSTDARTDVDDFQPADETTDFPYTSSYQQLAGRTGVTLTSLGGKLSTTLAIQGTQIERSIRDGSPRDFDGQRVKAEYNSLLKINDRLTFLLGADWEKTGFGSSDQPEDKDVSVAGAFVQLSIAPADGLTVTLGGRHDEHEAFGGFNTGRVAAAYDLAATGTLFRASAGTGFRAPSLYELFGSPFVDSGFVFEIGNADLQPEESSGWDAGIEQSFASGRYKLAATYFELDTKNLIIYAPFFGPFEQSPGTVKRRGVEVTGIAQIVPGLALTASYTFTNAIDTDETRLIRIPRHTASFGLRAEPVDKFRINVNALVRGDTIDTRFDPVTFQTGDVALDNFVQLNAKLSYEFAPGWTGYVRGENLLNREYQTVFGYGTSDLAIYGGVAMQLPSGPKW